MNLLPSMLIATTIIGGSGNIQADIPVDFITQAGQSANSQVIIGNSSNIESILGDLGVNMDSLEDCLLPETPVPELPDNNPGTPTPELPDNNTGSPDQNLPGTDTETPDTETPDVDKPGIDSPGTNHPDNGSGNEQDNEKSYVEQVVSLVNEERAKAGLPALAMSEDLNQAALVRAKETTQSFSHTRPNGTSFSTVLAENGISYRGAGENIAWGQRTPEAVVTAWMNSEGHRANILNAKYTTIGVGYYQNASQTPYWAQLFTY